MRRYYLLNQLDIVQPKEGQDKQAFVDSMLGRVVKRYQEPGRNFETVTRGEDSAEMKEATPIELDDWDQAASQAKSLKLKVAIEKLFGIEQEASTSGEKTVKGTKVFRHSLNDDAIQYVCDDAGVQKKLKKWLARGGARAWLVMGFVMVEKADISDKAASNYKAAAKVDVPGPVGDSPVALGGSAEAKADQHGGGKSSKLSVVAIEYKCLRRPLFSRGPDLVTEVRPGPQGLGTFRPKPGSAGAEAGGLEVEVLNATITDVLKDNDELDHEDFGDFSLAYAADEEEEDDDDERDDSDDSDEDGDEDD